MSFDAAAALPVPALTAAQVLTQARHGGSTACCWRNWHLALASSDWPSGGGDGDWSVATMKVMQPPVAAFGRGA